MPDSSEAIFYAGCARPPNLNSNECPIIIIDDQEYRLFNTDVGAFIQAMVNYLDHGDEAFLEVESQGPGFEPRVKPSQVGRALHPQTRRLIWPPEIK